MWKNYLKIAWRNTVRNKQYTFISILSLTLAITGAILIGMYLRHELSYDMFHSKASKIYRIAIQGSTGRTAGYAPLALPTYLKEKYAGVENFTRLWEYRRAMPVALPGEDISNYEEGFGWADSTFFEVFDFKFIHGSPENALDRLNTVVVTRSAALKYFGRTDVVGEEISFKAEVSIPFEITGVIEDFPTNSHFDFNFIASIRTADKYFWAGGRAGNWLHEWGNLFVSAYIIVNNPSQVTDLETISKELVNEKIGVPEANYDVFFQPLTDIHLSSHLDVGEYKANGYWRNIYLFAGVGITLLLLGGANFINLVTAQAGKRAKEIGLRKTFGGYRIQLMIQFFLETAFIIVFAYFLSLFLLDISIGLYKDFLGDLALESIFTDGYLLTGQILLLLTLWILSSFYPAFFMSSFKPLEVMRGSSSTYFGSGLFRKSLIVFQFIISATLLCSSVLIYKQVNYMHDKDPGFDDEMSLIIPIHNDRLILPALPTLKKEYLNHPDIEYVTASSHVFYATYTYQNSYTLEGKGDESFRWERYTVDHDFPKTYDLELVAGRYFSDEIATDSSALIINESAVDSWGITNEEALGRTMQNQTMDSEGTVVGVIKDFHFKSLHEAIKPFVIMVDPSNIDFITVKVNRENFESTVAFMKEKWNELIPGTVFNYEFHDSYHADIYQREEQLNSLIISFTNIAIVLSILGLYGLAQFVTSLRTKEIGVRKVLGATVKDILMLLNSYFIRLILIAVLISVPLSIYLTDLWLNNFAYRIDMNILSFLLPIALLLLVGLASISWKTFKAAIVNPTDVLKNE